MKQRASIATLCLLTLGLSYTTSTASVKDKPHKLEIILDYAGTLPNDHFSSFVKSFTKQINDWWKVEGSSTSKKDWTIVISGKKGERGKTIVSVFCGERKAGNILSLIQQISYTIVDNFLIDIFVEKTKMFIREQEGLQKNYI